MYLLKQEKHSENTSTDSFSVHLTQIKRKKCENWQCERIHGPKNLYGQCRGKVNYGPITSVSRWELLKTENEIKTAQNNSYE